MSEEIFYKCVIHSIQMNLLLPFNDLSYDGHNSITFKNRLIGFLCWSRFEKKVIIITITEDIRIDLNNPIDLKHLRSVIHDRIRHIL